MFEIELKNQEEMWIEIKNRTIKVNVAQSTIEAGLAVGVIRGAGEFEIGEATISGMATSIGNVMYRIEIGEVRVGVVSGEVKSEDLDELGLIDILGTDQIKTVGVVEPKVVIPMGNMDFADLKGSVKMEKRLKVKSAATLPAMMEIYKLD